MTTEDKIIFTIARMNPPTPGHKYLIKTMMEKALELNLSRIYLILSSTRDSEKNPIECEDKRMIIYTSVNEKIKEELKEQYSTKSGEIENIEIEVICMNDEIDITKYGKHPIISKINYLLGEKYGYPKEGLKMYLIIGEDRMNSYGFVLDFLINKIPSVGLEIIGLSRPAGAISATYIRGLVTSGREEDKIEFVNNMKEMGIKDTDIEILYNKLRTNIKPKTKTVKNTTRKTKIETKMESPKESMLSTRTTKRKRSSIENI